MLPAANTATAFDVILLKYAISIELIYTFYLAMEKGPRFPVFGQHFYIKWATRITLKQNAQES